jgi:hypothetical protein
MITISLTAKKCQNRSTRHRAMPRAAALGNPAVMSDNGLNRQEDGHASH